ncbi:CaiB/BaiF CoA-transferase family protein [Pseudonocardia eucalypti]|uniref:CaiB/BaiF CoA-transferase family protein n=1 Tax=Pseudonocardia eucalypti TaxID=648755 RepID=A0ABP9PQD3_9PSEU|nr:crotonobetainyl-CoA:carnitine CoA-transferase CaiB-like acyl-CoA transferase [Pseudonocardia eucalypti]
MTSTEAMRPLDGITVVACEQAVAAPMATRHLADLGARVIKIERPGPGDFARDYDTTVHGLSSHFVWLNRSKESVTLDLKHAEGARIARELVARADVFVQNLAPGAAARLGLGADELTAEHPRLVHCSISGYGEDGPYRDAKAYDLLIQAETGLMSITGTPEQPAKSGVPAADIAAGMYAYSGVLSALLLRERTGRGGAFSVSLFDGLTEWMGFPMYYTRYGGSAPVPAGAAHAAIAPYGPFGTGEGRPDVMLAIQNDREWVRFCESVLRRPELTRDERFADMTARVRHRDELRAEIEGVFAALTAAELDARLEEAKIAHSRRNGMAELIEHPQLAARNRWTEVGSPAGPLAALIPPVTVTAGPPPRMDPIPAIGQHTDAVLTELGYPADEVARLRAARAV